MKGADDLFGVFVGEGPEDSVHHVAQLAGVDEEHFARPVAEGGGSSASLLFRFGQEPDAGRYLRVGKELAGQGDHAFDKVRFDDRLANLAFALGVTAHRAIGQQQGHRAFGGKVIQHVLQPAKVGVAFGRIPMFPTRIAFQFAVPPFFHVERRIGHHVVGSQVRVQVFGETVGWLFAKVKVDPADGHVHRGQSPCGGVRFLSVNGDVADLAAVLFDEFLAGDKEAAAAHRGVVDSPFERFEHFDDQVDDGFGRVILPALFAFGECELTKEVFVDVAKDVFGVEVFVLEGDFCDQVDQADEALGR